MRLGHRTVHSVARWGALAACALVASGAVAQVAPKFFVGPVLQVTPKEHNFVMRGGASKKYPRVTVVCDAKTKWAGLSAASKSVEVGDPVRVTCVQQKNGSFKALEVFKQNPHEKPRMTGVSPNPSGVGGSTSRRASAGGSSRPADGTRRSGPGTRSRSSTGSERR